MEEGEERRLFYALEMKCSRVVGIIVRIDSTVHKNAPFQVSGLGELVLTKEKNC